MNKADWAWTDLGVAARTLEAAIDNYQRCETTLALELDTPERRDLRWIKNHLETHGPHECSMLSSVLAQYEFPA